MSIPLTWAWARKTSADCSAPSRWARPDPAGLWMTRRGEGASWPAKKRTIPQVDLQIILKFLYFARKLQFTLPVWGQRRAQPCPRSGMTSRARPCPARCCCCWKRLIGNVGLTRSRSEQMSIGSPWGKFYGVIIWCKNVHSAHKLAALRHSTTWK